MKVIKKELIFRTDSNAGIKSKSFVFVLDFLTVLSFFLNLAERDILTRFDHPFIMKMEYAF